MAFSRRFGRRRFSRRGRKRSYRLAKKIVRRVRRKIKKKISRKQRRKTYLYAYGHAKHHEATFGEVLYSNDGPSLTANGLFSSGDLTGMFRQVHAMSDIGYAGINANDNAQIKNNRQALRIRVRGEAIYKLTNGNTVGGAFIQVYVTRPRHNIPEDGIGTANSKTAAEIINANENSLFLPDWADATGVDVNQTGTGGITDIMFNSTSKTKPTVGGNNHWFTPFMVPEFTQNFKVLQVKKLYLPPSGTALFKVKTPWRVIDRSDTQLWDSDGTPRVYRGTWGRDVFFRVVGQPVHDATDHTQVNSCFVALDSMVDKRYWYSSAFGVELPKYYNPGDVYGTVGTAELPGEADQLVDETGTT